VNNIFLIDMNYIIANKELVAENSTIDLRSRRVSSDGLIMLNEKDLASVSGHEEFKLELISGLLYTENEALNELTKTNWQ
jgi:glutamine phosphoribosylpyrophosphate amidotransferase